MDLGGRGSGSVVRMGPHTTEHTMNAIRQTDRRTVLKTLGAGVVGTAASTGIGTAGGGQGRGKGPKSVVEIVASHDHGDNEHQFDLSPQTVPAGWTTLVLDNQTTHTHFAYTIKLPQQALDDAEAEGMDPLSFYYETVSRPFQYFSDAVYFPDKKPDPDDNTDIYDAVLPSWFLNDVTFYGGPGLTMGPGDSMTTVNFDEGTYIVECYVKDDENDFHSYRGMLGLLTVTSGESKAAEPESTLDLGLSTSGIEFPNEVSPGRHTVGVEVSDQKQYANLVGHDVNLIRLDGEGQTGPVNNWMDWTDPEQLISDGTESGPFLGGVQDIWTGDLPRTGYFHVGLGAGDYAWVAEVPDPDSKGLLETFTVTPP
jgi:hypothetical protein